MALSKQTVNRHNVRRAEVFAANGLNTMDIQYAYPHFGGYGHGECTLCGKKHLKWLFSIKFRRPSGIVALAKVMTDIIRDDEVTLHPVGSKCITDWLDAVPETQEKLEALKRWEREMAKCKRAMKAKVVEDLCKQAGYASPEDAYQAFVNLDRAGKQRALNYYDWRRLTRNARKVRNKSGSRGTIKTWLEDLQKVIDFVPEAPAQPSVDPVVQGLLDRGRAAWANKDRLDFYYQGVFEDIGQKVARAGKFASAAQKNYYTDLLKKLETG